MATADINEIYARHIRPLSSEDRRQLLAIMARDLAALSDEQKIRSLMELEGVGAEL